MKRVCLPFILKSAPVAVGACPGYCECTNMPTQWQRNTVLTRTAERVAWGPSVGAGLGTVDCGPGSRAGGFVGEGLGKEMLVGFGGAVQRGLLMVGACVTCVL